MQEHEMVELGVDKETAIGIAENDEEDNDNRNHQHGDDSDEGDSSGPELGDVIAITDPNYENIESPKKENQGKKKNETKKEQKKKGEKDIEKQTIKRETGVRHKNPTKQDMGVRPYIQIFKDGQLIWTSRKKKKPLQFFEQSDRSMKFVVQKELEGDILVRVRHLCSDNRTKISVCRFAFHTGYLEDHGMIRFTKSQLDGAWNSDRFPKDFMIDMVIGNVQQEDTAQSRFSELFWNEIERRSLMLENARAQRALQQEQKRQMAKSEKEEEEKNAQAKTESETTRESAKEPIQEGHLSENEGLAKSGNHITIAQSNTNEHKDTEPHSKPITHTPLQEPLAEELFEVFEPDNKPNGKDGPNELDDLEKFADGLDLENIQVDSDTEQYFEELNQKLLDSNTTKKKPPTADELDLLSDTKSEEAIALPNQNENANTETNHIFEEN